MYRKHLEKRAEVPSENLEGLDRDPSLKTAIETRTERGTGIIEIERETEAEIVIERIEKERTGHVLDLQEKADLKDKTEIKKVDTDSE